MIAVTLSNGRVLRIATSNVCPPIPDRRFDWSAIDDSTYDGEGCPVGRGRTEREAIDDLIERICADEDICPPDCWGCQQESAAASTVAP